MSLYRDGNWLTGAAGAIASNERGELGSPTTLVVKVLRAN